ncbi:MAG TPA: carboxypeptidase-like regulatory domain-containing protein, partial [Bacteroidales bacterium]|nr:carboxypeptidase-like regulatory domain-containing protein [Bacteroidales bacterium]
MKFFLLLSILFPLQLRAQMNVHVVDSETSEAVSNALIMVDSTTIGISDQHGSFYIDLIDSSFKLTVKCLGYETYSAVISHRAANLLIKLIPSSHQLSEVVVSNQMTNQKLRSLAGNYSMLTRSDLLRGNSVTIADYFNQLPGVFIQQGALNTNRLTIRGVGSRTPYITNRIKAYFDEI